MPQSKYRSAVDAYIEEFQNDPYNVDEYKVNFLKNHFYSFVENYMNVNRENLLIGATSNKKYLYFQCNLNTDIHFVYNLNNPSCNYLKCDYPTKFVEELNSDELHYKKYKTLMMKKGEENYKNRCCVII
jgi:hypothetical protein